MPEDKNSAEKDLLKLIENPLSAAEYQKKAPETDLIKSAPISALSGKGSKKTSSPKKHVPFNFASLKERRFILKVMAIAAVLGIVYLFFSVYSEYTKLQKAKNLDKFTYIVNGKEQKITGPGETTENLSNASEPEKESGFRNIFKPAAQKSVEQKGDGSRTALQDYKLVGISLDSATGDSYAMIENVKSKTTFFLKKGEKIDGMELLMIFEDKLVLNSQGQNIELR